MMEQERQALSWHARCDKELVSNTEVKMRMAKKAAKKFLGGFQDDPRSQPCIGHQPFVTSNKQSAMLS
jgi:hypothetical protein